jgi:hypothetical protein
VTIAARWFASLLPDPSALDGLNNSLRETAVDIPVAKGDTAKPIQFANVLTGAAVDTTYVDSAIRLNVAECLGGLPAVWLIGNRQ